MSYFAPTQSANKPLKNGIIIVCEDSKGNYYYLDKKVRDCQPNAVGIKTLIVNSQDAGGATQAHKLAAYAIQAINDSNKSFYGDDPSGEIPPEPFYNEAYCIVDVDNNHITPYRAGSSTSSLTQAYTLIDSENSKSRGITYHLIVSNECFEVWYMLHFQDLTTPLYRRKSHLKALILPDKSNSIEFLLLKHAGRNNKKYEGYFEIMRDKGDESAALSRAKSLKSGSIDHAPNDNPSTDLFVLIDRLNTFKT